jgi:hypothetical protein
MKTLQEMLNTSDRMSTHEELHQVLALLDERAPVAVTEAPGEADEANALREAVADLWRESIAEEPSRQIIDVRSELYPWADMLAGKRDRIN